MPLELPFRPRARLLQLLGDQLIGSPRLAVFELVKNAYDADATEVVVTLDLRDVGKPTIAVTDDGDGMTLETLQNVWLVPGDDHRAKQRNALVRSTKHRRLPLGEKGLGRFAVHKLGNEISLVTRAKDADEYVINIRWSDMITKPFLADAPVSIQAREPQVFTGTATGTRIEISDLRDVTWTRGEVRRLQRQIVSICSPFHEPSGFRAILEVPGEEDWIADIPDVAEILARAIWKFTFHFRDGIIDWTYTFRQVPSLKLSGRTLEKVGETLQLPVVLDDGGPAKRPKKVVADANLTDGIGPVSGELYVYDRDREVLRLLTDVQLIQNYLDENGGVRVYRDGMRVYNYGEPGDDWLGLDLRRVNAPTQRISRNIVVGAVHLSLETSSALVEKTNREGFVENDAFRRLRQLVLGAMAKFESERHVDKDRIRQLVSKRADPGVERIEKPIAQLRQALARDGSLDRFEHYIGKIESDYREMQETLLTAGMAGLNLAVIFHEVERGVRALHQAIIEPLPGVNTALQARDLMQLLDGFATLLRRDSRSDHSAFKLLSAAKTYSMLRLRHHHVRLVCPLLEKAEPGFVAKFSFGLVAGALANLIDNSLYWMRVRWPERPPDEADTPRALYLGISDEFDYGPSIVVADTGPGLTDEPQRLVRPFFTRKPDGMGLGLYYANLAMELNGGQLVFPARGDVSLPPGFDGAVVALVFKKVG